MSFSMIMLLRTYKCKKVEQSTNKTSVKFIETEWGGEETHFQI